jgi:oligopeptide transport system ATP-binding protein
MPALLEGKALTKSYRHAGRWIPAVHEASFFVNAGETLGIVGASGSGKSTLARMIVGLEKPDQGNVLWQGQPLTWPRSTADRRNMNMVFQSPIASCNPRMTVGDIVAEPLDLQHLSTSRAQRTDRINQAWLEVGLEPSINTRRPHELSGGQQQRVAIARALVTKPALLVADEPLSALDVSVGAQIANLLMDLQSRLGLSYIFISHDRHMVAHLAHRVLNMNAGVVTNLVVRDDAANTQSEGGPSAAAIGVVPNASSV